MVDSLDRADKRVGIEVSNAAFTAVFLDGNDKVTSTRNVAIDGSQPAAPQLFSFINDIRTNLGEVSTIGVAIPGLLDPGTKRVIFSANIPEYSGLDLAGEIYSATGLKATLENDANAAAYGEFRLGAGRGSRNLFYATLGLGVGGAFIFDGAIWRGASGFAGEFGYIPINSDGLRLEDVASTANIIRRTRSRFHQ